MEFLFTIDPTVIIVYQIDYNLIIYFNVYSNESWLIYGQCDHRKGYCIEGAINPDKREYYERLDCPVRPEFEGCCDLRGEYL